MIAIENRTLRIRGKFPNLIGICATDIERPKMP